MLYGSVDGNRHAMDYAVSKVAPEKSIGVLYCDVMGLKKENDSFGHGAGDALLIRASKCLQRGFGEYALFRIGGDEFLVLCEGISREELSERVTKGADILTKKENCKNRAAQNQQNR